MTFKEVLVGKSLGRSLVRGLTVGVLLLVGSQILLTPVRAHGISMVPTYAEGQLLWVNRLAYVFINDRPLDEPYCVYRLPWNILEAQLGPDEVFVIGDNRSMQERFHDFGRADRGRILGRMIN
jgi:hypothetical protein